MELEKEIDNIRWFKKADLKIRVKNKTLKSEIAVLFEGYNIGLKLMMYDFIIFAKEEMLIDISSSRCWDNQYIFLVNSEDVTILISYIQSFINEWDIQISESTISSSDAISDEIWYSLS